MQLFKDKTYFDFMGKIRGARGLSGIVILIGLGSIVFSVLTTSNFTFFSIGFSTFCSTFI